GWGAYPKLLANGSIPDLDPNLAGDIDNSLLEKDEEVTIEWAEEQQTYDVRGRKNLGKVHTQKTMLSAWEPLVYTRASQPLPALKILVASGARAGEMVEIILADEGALPEDAFRVVHLEFKTPSGELYDLYARNVLARTFPYSERVPFAVNDPKGSWKVIAHDLITGQVVESSFELR